MEKGGGIWKAQAARRPWLSGQPGAALGSHDPWTASRARFGSATNVAFLLKHRGAVLAPPVRVRHPLGSAAGLFRSRWFAIGWMVAVGAWLLHVGALALAPLSIVQAVMAGGIVFLAVLSERYFGFHLGRWQWIGVTITGAGLAVIGFTGGGATRPQQSSLAALIAVEGAIVAVAATLLAISAHRSVRAGRGAARRPGRRGAVRRLQRRDQVPHPRPGPVPRVAESVDAHGVIAGAIPFFASARSLQVGPAVEAIAFTSVAADLAAIIGGVLVFEEPIGSGPFEIGARFIAFCLVIAGAALMPGHRTERRETVDPPSKVTLSQGRFGPARRQAGVDQLSDDAVRSAFGDADLIADLRSRTPGSCAVQSSTCPWLLRKVQLGIFARAREH